MKRIADINRVEDLARGQRALPAPGESWTVSQMQGIGAALATVSHLVRVADVIYAVALCETPEKTVDRSHYPITGDRSFVIRRAK